MSEEEVQRISEEGELEAKYNVEIGSRMELMRHFKKKSVKEFRFQSYEECQEYRDKLRSNIKEMYVAASCLKVVHMSGKFA